MYAEAFDGAGALDKLEAFASFHGADFYGLPRNTGTITLRRESWTPDSFAYGEAQLKPLRAGDALPWRVVDARLSGMAPPAAGLDPAVGRMAGAGARAAKA
jgi:dihydroorotase